MRNFYSLALQAQDFVQWCCKISMNLASHEAPQTTVQCGERLKIEYKVTVIAHRDNNLASHEVSSSGTVSSWESFSIDL